MINNSYINKKILELLNSDVDREFSTKEVVRAAGISYNGVILYLHRLVEDKVIERSGSSGPSGYRWKKAKKKFSLAPR